MFSRKASFVVFSLLASVLALVMGMRHVSFTASGRKGNIFVFIIGYVSGGIQITPNVHDNDLHYAKSPTDSYA